MKALKDWSDDLQFTQTLDKVIDLFNQADGSMYIASLLLLLQLVTLLLPNTVPILNKRLVKGHDGILIDMVDVKLA